VITTNDTAGSGPAGDGLDTSGQNSHHNDAEALTRHYPYYDPIYTLDQAGQNWWQARQQ
jgi:hypothetical protein